MVEAVWESVARSREFPEAQANLGHFFLQLQEQHRGQQSRAALCWWWLCVLPRERASRGTELFPATSLRLREWCLNVVFLSAVASIHEPGKD